MWTCDARNKNQQWDILNDRIKNRHGVCLDTNERDTTGGKVHMIKCDPYNTNQQWKMMRANNTNQQWEGKSREELEDDIDALILDTIKAIRNKKKEEQPRRLEFRLRRLRTDNFFNSSHAREECKLRYRDGLESPYCNLILRLNDARLWRQNRPDFFNNTFVPFPELAKEINDRYLYKLNVEACRSHSNEVCGNADWKDDGFEEHCGTRKQWEQCFSADVSRNELQDMTSSKLLNNYINWSNSSI